jgi:hypothetical protein
LAYSDDIGKVGKNWVHYVEILPRTCDNVYGVAPCTASGGQCAYSWATCEDKDNFVLTTTTFKFSSKNGSKIFDGTQVQPTLVTVSEIPTEIDPNKSVTINARMQLIFEDVKNPPPFHSEKGTGKFHPYRNSTFWNIFTRIYRESYKYCVLRIYEGLSSYTQLSDFSLRREYQINNIEFVSGGKVRIIATDKTRVSKNIKIPNAISSSNVTTAVVTADALTIPVTDGSEFVVNTYDVPYYPYTITIWSFGKIIDPDAGDEYFAFRTIQSNNLVATLLTVDEARGLFGTAAVAHAAGCKVIQVARFTHDTDTGISSDIGMSPVQAISLEILQGWLGLSANDDIDTDQFDSEEETWYSSITFRRIVETPTDANKLLQQLNQLLMSNIWQNEDQKLTFRGIHPPTPVESVTMVELKTSENILDGSLKIDNKTETQVSRVIVHFSPNDIWGTKDHTSEDDFNEHLILINAAAENSNGQADVVEKEFYADWIYQLKDAKSFANKYMRRYSPVAPSEVRYEVYRRDSEIETGDIIDITSDKFVEDDGSDATLNFQVLAKSEAQNGVIKMKALETKFVLRYAFITYTGWPDYLIAVGGRLFGFISELDSEGNATMSNGDPAYYIW